MSASSVSGRAVSWQLGGPRQRAPLALPIDPDAADAESATGATSWKSEAATWACRSIGPGLQVEGLPMPDCGLVRADLGRDDPHVNRHADRPQRRVEEVRIRVRQDRQAPATVAQLGERGGHVGRPAIPPAPRPEHPPARRDAEARLAPRPPGSRPSPGGTGCPCPPVRPVQSVVAGEQPIGVGMRPQVREAVAHAAQPVDERAVAVEGGPSVAHRPSLVGRYMPRQTLPKKTGMSRATWIAIGRSRERVRSARTPKAIPRPPWRLSPAAVSRRSRSRRRAPARRRGPADDGARDAGDRHQPPKQRSAIDRLLHRRIGQGEEERERETSQVCLWEGDRPEERLARRGPSRTAAAPMVGTTTNETISHGREGQRRPCRPEPSARVGGRRRPPRAPAPPRPDG